ncbi:hypothetical protein HanIR_Chr16g0800061 [Helianthus annuus]|nr:hypothetical protein HanIR_Chr16g0800061 [Helianthus annuus]
MRGVGQVYGSSRPSIWEESAVDASALLDTCKLLIHGLFNVRSRRIRCCRSPSNDT